MVTMSEREGLLVPAFCALIVRRVRIVLAKASAMGGTGPDVEGFPSEPVKAVVCGLLSVREVSLWCPLSSLVAGCCPLVGRMCSSEECGDPGGE
jgi:hypothetical protein